MLAFNEYNCGRLFGEATEIINSRLNELTVEESAFLTYLLMDREILENATLNEVGLRSLWQGVKGFFGGGDEYQRTRKDYEDEKGRLGINKKNDPSWFGIGRGARDWWNTLKMMDARHKDKAALDRDSRLKLRQKQLQGIRQQYIDAGIEDQMPDEVRNSANDLDYDFNPVANMASVKGNIKANLLRSKASNVMKRTGSWWTDDTKNLAPQYTPQHAASHQYNFSPKEPTAPQTLKIPKTAPAAAPAAQAARAAPQQTDWGRLNTTLSDLSNRFNQYQQAQDKRWTDLQTWQKQYAPGASAAGTTQTTQAKTPGSTGSKKRKGK